MANVFDRTIEAGELLVLSKSAHNEKYQNIEFRLFIADGHGSGCNPSALGSAVYGKFANDGEECRYEGDEDFDAEETQYWQERIGKFGEGLSEFLKALEED